ncbi:MAG: zf-HC2 domain-containing protein [Pirellulaceae bacterium]|nr:zf-HC2 domain-containing protein [Pirellulaceae bacterium]
MHCDRVETLLSAYFDGELDNVVADEVRVHLTACDRCAIELRSYQQLRNLMAVHVEAPVTLPSWEAIANAIDKPLSEPLALATVSSNATNLAIPNKEPMTSAVPLTKRVWIGTILTLAASLFVMASIRQPSHSPSHSTSHSPSHSTVQASVATINLQPILELFQKDARLALEAISKQFAGRDVSIEKAEASFGHPVFMNESFKNTAMPGDAHLSSTRLLRFPYCRCPPGECHCGPNGCNCVVCVCQRPDGSTYLVIEHCKSQSVTFGDLPVRLVTRGDRQIQQVEMEGSMAVSWDEMNGRLTAIGLRGQDELEMLLAVK